MRRRSHRTDEAIAVGLTAPLNCRNGKTSPTWSKMLKLIRCSTIANTATDRRACDEELRQVLDRAPAANDGDEQVVNENEAEEEGDRLQHRRRERTDPSDVDRE